MGGLHEQSYPHFTGEPPFSQSGPETDRLARALRPMLSLHGPRIPGELPTCRNDVLMTYQGARVLYNFGKLLFHVPLVPFLRARRPCPTFPTFRRSLPP